MNVISKYLTLCFACILLFACNEENTTFDNTEPVNLTFTLKAPEITVDTRGLNDPSTDPSTWTPWEQAVDGQKIYRVTVFIIEVTTNKLVAFRDIYHDSDHLTDNSNEYGPNGFSSGGVVNTSLQTSDEVTLTFKYDKPRHGDIEKLRRGEFRLLAVANYSKYSSYGNTYYGIDATSGNPDGTGFPGLITNIKSTFDAGQGIDNFTSSNATYSDFFNYTLTAPDGYVLKKEPQALSFAADIQLHPGDNHVSGQLVRTRARIKIDVDNNSSTAPLTINNLTFDNFAQKQTYLFDLPTAPNRKYTDFTSTVGAITSTSSNAITKFTANTEIAKQNRATIFDGYILESNLGSGNYEYTVDLEYKGKTYEGELLVDATEYKWADIETIKSLANTKYFLIKNIRSGEFLYVSNDDIHTKSIDINTLDPNTSMELLWQLQKKDDNTYYIYNVGADRYISGPGETFVGTSITKGDLYFGFSQCGTTEYIQIGYQGGSNYLNEVNYNDRICYYWENGDGGNSMSLYATNYNLIPAAYNNPITLTTIDPITAHNRDVSTIKRNDFINVLISVAYDENKGHFDFVVKDWIDNKGGNITYE